MIKFLSVFLITFSWLSVASTQNVSLDKQLGAENAKMVEAQMGIYPDEEKTAYIRKVGERLIAQLEKPLFDYQFHIVPELTPNAFALPGGYVYVTTGLIPILESEDELACILAHEIIHANNRHSIKQLEKSILPRLLEIPGNLIGVFDQNLGAIFNAPIKTSNALLFASYSRKAETEADEEGIKLAAAAGYDTNAMIIALIRLSATIEVATGQKEQKSYFNDHPYTPDRAKSIEKTQKKLDAKKEAPISADFINEFDSLLFGDSPSKGVIKENQFLHPDIDFSIHFPEGWTIENQPTNVGAYHPERKAAVFVSLEEQGLSPIEAGNRMIENLDKENKGKLSGVEPYEVNGNKGYLITFTEKTKDLTMYSYVLWLPLKNNLFKIVGLAPHRISATIRKNG